MAGSKNYRALKADGRAWQRARRPADAERLKAPRLVAVPRV
jgi:hypothetical protein